MIWYVEDDASIRDIAIYALNSAGFETKGFEDGLSFWEALRKEKPELIVLDVMLPGMDGIELLSKMKDSMEYSTIPVIMATAKGQEYDRIRGLDLGADDYIVKPFSPNEVMARLRAVLRRMTRADREKISEKNENIWIAQREGRAKDSNDITAPAIIKMLNMSGEGTFVEKLRALNITPVAINYEYDPCDYLKAREMQLKRDNPKWRKSRKDDLVSMAVGIKGHKGRIVYRLTPSINHAIDKALDNHPELRESSRNEQIQFVCQLIDHQIHSAYEIYDRGEKFDQYIQSRIDLIHLSQKDTDFLREKLYEMYNNPVENHKKALASEC